MKRVEMWRVYRDGKPVKSYPTREQCMAWCLMQGLVVRSGWRKWLVPGVEIRGPEDSQCG